MPSNQLTTDPAQETALILRGDIQNRKDMILKSMPKGFDSIERVERAAMRAMHTTPKLAECSRESLLISIVEGFMHGIEPGGLTRWGYLIPRWNSKKNCLESCFQVSYMGMIELARRSGLLAGTWANLVYANEPFQYFGGTEHRLEHVPDPFRPLSERGDLIGVYAVARMKDGFHDFETMAIGEVFHIRDRAMMASRRDWKPGNKITGPWDTDQGQMARKTVWLRLFKRMPVEIETQQAQNLELPPGERDPEDSRVPREIRDSFTDTPQPLLGEEASKPVPEGGLNEMFAASPVDEQEMRDCFTSTGTPWDEGEIKRNFRTYVSRTMNYRETQS